MRNSGRRSVYNGRRSPPNGHYAHKNYLLNAKSFAPPIPPSKLKLFKCTLSKIKEFHWRCSLLIVFSLHSVRLHHLKTAPHWVRMSLIFFCSTFLTFGTERFRASRRTESTRRAFTRNTYLPTRRTSMRR